jgi:hypothetical protein
MPDHQEEPFLPGIPWAPMIFRRSCHDPSGFLVYILPEAVSM